MIGSLEVVGGTNSAGFPCISEEAFRAFEDEVPHLFRDGLHLLRSLDAKEPGSEVLRGLVLMAAVSAPPDLWLLRHVLAAHARLGTLTSFLEGEGIVPAAFAETHALNSRELTADLDLLYGRGYLDRRARDGAFVLASNLVARSLFVYAIERMQMGITVPGEVSALSQVLSGTADSASTETVRAFLELPAERNTAISERAGWIAGPLEVEIGYRLVPLVLALHETGFARLLMAEGVSVVESVPTLTPQMTEVLACAGLVDEDLRTTPLAVRVFGRGIGPFGIIHSYYPYMEAREVLLREGAGAAGLHVARTENVISSQEANRKSFQLANDALDAFCARRGFRFSVFIEHAMGLGEATRQRWQRDQLAGRSDIVYVGADLEEAPIERAWEAQTRGVLPPSMVLVGGADIGKPADLLAALERAELPAEGAVMMIGNGFHEIRHQTDEHMVGVFRAYAEAGILLIFTEESALPSNDLRATGWNTYHAGFRYVHALSGQGLRPSVAALGMPLPWRVCAERGGFTILDEFTRASRGIYPCERSYNPPVSVTYFAVPNCKK